LLGRRVVGRPRLRWEDNIRRHSLLLLNIRGWRRWAGNRNIWIRTIREVTARCGLSCIEEEEVEEEDSLFSSL
jgi:hypothetical protein